MNTLVADGQDGNASRPRRLLQAALGVMALVVLSGCGSPAPDPGAQRSDIQSKELRDRIQQIQGRN